MPESDGHPMAQSDKFCNRVKISFGNDYYGKLIFQ